MTGRGFRLTVAVPTYRRHEQLNQLVPLLQGQVEGIMLAGLVSTADLLVIDNDPDGSAKRVIDALAIRSPVRYVHERQAGLAAVRNRALDETDGSDLLAFIDDDEVPEPDWLRLMVATWAVSEPAAVAGRVLERFVETPDPWIVAGGFFRRASQPTGRFVDAAPTSNLLLDLRQVTEVGLRFDDRFGLSGGEDTLFTRSLTLAGRRIVWCNEACVTDVVPAHRAVRGWVLRRAVSHGNSGALVVLALPHQGKMRVRLRLVVGGAVRAGAGVSRFAYGRLSRSAPHEAKGLRLACRGWGMIMGSVSKVVNEYAR